MLASVNSVQASSTSRLIWWKGVVVADTVCCVAVRKCELTGRKAKGKRKKNPKPRKPR